METDTKCRVHCAHCNEFLPHHKKECPVLIVEAIETEIIIQLDSIAISWEQIKPFVIAGANSPVWDVIRELENALEVKS